jgi:hypothetical protein
MDPKATWKRLQWHLAHECDECPEDQREQIESDLSDLLEWIGKGGLIPFTGKNTELWQETCDECETLIRPDIDEHCPGCAGPVKGTT